MADQLEDDYIQTAEEALSDFGGSDGGDVHWDEDLDGDADLAPPRQVAGAKLQVCDVCGAYLSRLDNDRRLADHFFGKMHLGYAQMRKTYDAFPKDIRPRRPHMGNANDEEMGGVPTGPGGGYGNDGGWGKGMRGPRSGGGGGGGFRGGRGGRRGGW